MQNKNIRPNGWEGFKLEYLENLSSEFHERLQDCSPHPGGPGDTDTSPEPPFRGGAIGLQFWGCPLNLQLPVSLSPNFYHHQQCTLVPTKTGRLIPGYRVHFGLHISKTAKTVEQLSQFSLVRSGLNCTKYSLTTLLC